MTTGVQCRADPRCEIPAPAKNGICHCHTQQANKTRAAVRGPSLAERVKQAWSREPEKELEP
jgi:hypothetical protein